MGKHIVTIKNSKILIVDDKQENLELLTNILEAENFEIAFSTNGEEAIKIATLFQPQLILLDVMMPGIDGFETCRRIKSLPDLSETPVIFVTGKSAITDIVEAFNVGGVDYVTKPIRHEEIIARVTTHLQLQALISLRDELIGTLRKQNIELEQLAQIKDIQLEKSEQFNHIGELVGELSHEISTPLGIINTAITSLEENRKQLVHQIADQQLSKTRLDEFLSITSDSLNIVLSNLQHTIHLVNSFKQIIVGEFSQNKTQFGVKSYLEDIQHILIPKLKRCPHRFSFTCEDSIVMSAESGALSQVLINLINNAIVHAFEEKQEGEIIVKARVDGDHVVFDVIDNGTGISEEQQSKIFEKYFTTREGKGGSGLGLYIVKNLVINNLNGSITFYNNESGGGCFSVRLPKESS